MIDESELVNSLNGEGVRFSSPEEVFFAVVEVEDDISLCAVSSKITDQLHRGDSSHSIVL